MTHTTVTRRDAIQGLGGLGLAATLPAARAAPGGPGSLSFLAVGDWGREGAYRQRDVAVRMGETARELDARFVVSVGDNFYEDGVASVADPAWRKSFEEIYDAPSLQVPWHVALGNHDYRGSVEAQIHYTEHSSRWRLPARWYSFEEPLPDGTRVELFVTDTTPLIDFYYRDPKTGEQAEGQRAAVPAQLAWLDQALERSRAHWKIVIGHHPVYSGWIEPGRRLRAASPDLGLRTLGGTPDLMARLDPILRRHRVPLYINGHNHDLQHVRMGATDFVCTGAGSKIGTFCDLGGADFCALRSGFVAVTIRGERLRVAYRDYTGARLDVVDIRRAT